MTPGREADGVALAGPDDGRAGDRPLRRWARSVAVAAGIVLVVAAALWWFSPVLARWADGRFPDVLFHVETDRRAVALTVDDAPSPVTREILDLLHRHGARATFFVLGGRVSGREEVLRRVVRDGHELGNHMMEDRPTWRLHPDALGTRMREAGRILARFDTVRWFRPGGGWFDEDVVRTARESGYRVALGSLYPFDVWLPWPGVLANFVDRKARPGDVLVLHDGAERGRRTLEVLARVLPALRRRGFRVVTLSELAGAPVHPAAAPAAIRSADLRAREGGPP